METITLGNKLWLFSSELNQTEFYARLGFSMEIRRYNNILYLKMFFLIFMTSLWTGIDFSIRNECVSGDILTNLTEYEFVIVIHIMTKVGSNRTTNK